MSSSEKHLGRHVFCFNEEDNGGESCLLITDFWDNGDGVISGMFTIQEFELNSYCNSAKICLQGVQITPEKLRKLADELDLEIARIKTQAMIDAKVKNGSTNETSSS